MTFRLFQQITFALGNISNLKSLSPAELTDFPQIFHVESWKKTVERSIVSFALSVQLYLRLHIGGYTLPQ